ENCHYVLLAVKPQVYRVVLAKIAPVCRPDSVFISIAAGISGERIKKELGYDAKVIQVMPNTPVLVGCGASALSCFAPATQEEFEQVQSIFAASGYAVQIKPEQMNDVIPINGSSPAIFYYIAQIVVERAVELGFDKDVANNLICQAMIGSAKMMLESGKSHQELIDMVSSKGGTTLAMSAAMKDHQFKEALLAGVDACIRRACELGE
ncbi:MAG: pyrroline-5-carboxylate reductase dimerization domain-containing protein, partial [Oscillospiraceae bacterium]